MIEIKHKDKLIIIIPGICQECNCEVTSENIGFECNEFIICKKCNKETEEEYDIFQEEMNDDPLKRYLNNKI